MTGKTFVWLLGIIAYHNPPAASFPMRSFKQSSMLKTMTHTDKSVDVDSLLFSVPLCKSLHTLCSCVLCQRPRFVQKLGVLVFWS